MTVLQERNMTNLYTIGFTHKKAKVFFELLKINDVKKVIDIRLNNNSQLAAFSKRDDLKYFLKELTSIDYCHELILSPTEDILNAYKKGTISWEEYEIQFLQLLHHRKPEDRISLNSLDRSCLLCSEPTPEMCHRRLVAEYFRELYTDIQIIHL